MSLAWNQTFFVGNWAIKSTRKKFANRANAKLIIKRRFFVIGIVRSWPFMTYMYTMDWHPLLDGSWQWLSVVNHWQQSPFQCFKMTSQQMHEDRLYKNFGARICTRKDNLIIIWWVKPFGKSLCLDEFLVFYSPLLKIYGVEKCLLPKWIDL